MIQLFPRRRHLDNSRGEVPAGAWGPAVCGAGEETSLLSSRHTPQLLETDSLVPGAGRGGRMLINIDHTFSELPGPSAGGSRGTGPC